MKKAISVCMVVIIVFIHGYGGGGSKNNPTSSVADPAAVQAVYADLNSSNLSCPYMVADKKVKRWSVEKNLIPVKLNNSREAIAAVDLIEKTLGKTLFDRTSIANTPDSEITRGLIVSMGTAVNPSGTVDESTWGNIGGAPGALTPVENMLDESGVMGGRWYIMIGSSMCSGAQLYPVAVHEFAHALGLQEHFDGYGNGGGIIAGNFWNVLKSLYFSPIGSSGKSVKVYTGVVEGDGKSGIASAGPDEVISGESIVLQNLRAANLNNSILKDDGKLKRWAVEKSLIPVNLNGSPEATAVVDLIEKTLGKTLFDRTSIANTPDSEITRGLIVSMGSAVNQNNVVTSGSCMAISSAPGKFGTDPGSIQVDATDALSLKAYLNIGSSLCNQHLDQMALMGFGYSMGVMSRFGGFMDGYFVRESFWNVLKTMYSNPIGASEANITTYSGVVPGDPNSGKPE